MARRKDGRDSASERKGAFLEMVGSYLAEKFADGSPTVGEFGDAVTRAAEKLGISDPRPFVRAIPKGLPALLSLPPEIEEGIEGVLDGLVAGYFDQQTGGKQTIRVISATDVWARLKPELRGRFDRLLTAHLAQAEDRRKFRQRMDKASVPEDQVKTLEAILLAQPDSEVWERLEDWLKRFSKEEKKEDGAPLGEKIRKGLSSLEKGLGDLLGIDEQDRTAAGEIVADASAYAQQVRDAATRKAALQEMASPRFSKLSPATQQRIRQLAMSGRG